MVVLSQINAPILPHGPPAQEVGHRFELRTTQKPSTEPSPQATIGQDLAGLLSV
jgi:hypothetical protein